jgi:hypothetical protein
MARRKAGTRWVRTVDTDSTHPPEGTFKKSAGEIAATLARKDVSPKGPGSGVRMIQYFINRGGKGLSKSRRQTLERAKRTLQETAAERRAQRARSGRRKPGKKVGKKKNAGTKIPTARTGRRRTTGARKK